jgi:hypothetical protein
MKTSVGRAALMMVMQGQKIRGRWPGLFEEQPLHPAAAVT